MTGQWKAAGSRGSIPIRVVVVVVAVVAVFLVALRVRLAGGPGDVGDLPGPGHGSVGVQPVAGPPVAGPPVAGPPVAVPLRPIDAAVGAGVERTIGEIGERVAGSLTEGQREALRTRLAPIRSRRLAQEGRVAQAPPDAEDRSGLSRRLAEIRAEEEIAIETLLLTGQFDLYEEDWDPEDPDAYVAGEDPVEDHPSVDVERHARAEAAAAVERIRLALGGTPVVGEGGDAALSPEEEARLQAALERYYARRLMIDRRVPFLSGDRARLSATLGRLTRHQEEREGALRHILGEDRFASLRGGGLDLDLD
ncbi:MAG: hypothetical protein HY608_04765 [Planctomycetes bacterium]|nr:hypothetical protein [Planctomycetota bacterium]